MTIQNGESGFSVRTKLNTALAQIAELQASEVTLTPESFGSTTTDSTAAINAMFAYCVPRNINMQVSGDHNISGTIAPGGKYNCHWSNAKLTYVGSNPSQDLVELQENPSASGSNYVGAGKYVLFDTKDCGRSQNTGDLTIQAFAPGNMKRENEASIPSNVVALSCSMGNSAQIMWDRIQVIGCGHALWQGDLRGSAPNILPYTGWSVRVFEAQFCIEAITAGFSGNGLDDGVWEVVRLVRNRSNGRIRTDWLVNSLFLRGKRFDRDGEAITVDTTGATVEMSADILDEGGASRIEVGQVIAIEGAGADLGEAIPSPHVSRISAKSGTTLTIETPVETDVTGATVVFNPPSLFVQTGDLKAYHLYLEGLLDAPVILFDESSVWTASYKISDGEFGARYGSGIICAGMAGMEVRATLHQRSGRLNSFAKYLVGWGNLQFSGDLNRGVVNLHTRNSEDEFIAGSSVQPIGVVELESDHSGANTVVAGVEADMRRDLSCSFDTGTRLYHALNFGPATKGPKRDYDILSLGSNLRSNDDMTGVSNSGGCGAPSAGVVEKATDPVGFWYEDIGTQTAGDLLYVSFVVDAFPENGVFFRLFDSSGTDTPAGDIVGDGIPILSTGFCEFHVVVPSTGTVDTAGFQCFLDSRITISSLIIKKVVSN